MARSPSPQQLKAAVQGLVRELDKLPPKSASAIKRHLATIGRFFESVKPPWVTPRWARPPW